MFLDWLDEVRKKPKVIRNQYAFIGASVITALIVVVWSVSIPMRLSGIGESTTEGGGSVGAFSQFFGDVRKNFASVIESARNATSTTDAVETDAGVVLRDASTTPDETTASSSFIFNTADEESQTEPPPEPRHVLIETVSATATGTEETATSTKD